MYIYKCLKCGKNVEFEEEYVPEYCCSGQSCGCLGLPINPMFCEDCEDEIFDPNINKKV